jgi:hypothetical protein
VRKENRPYVLTGQRLSFVVLDDGGGGVGRGELAWHPKG